MELRSKIETRLNELVVQIKKGHEEVLKTIQELAKNPTKAEKFTKGAIIRDSISKEFLFIELANLIDNDLSNCSQEATELHKLITQQMDNLKKATKDNTDIPEDIKEFLNGD